MIETKKNLENAFLESRPTLSFWRDVHAVLDFHVPAEVPLQVELTGAVRTLEGLVASMKMHVAQQVVHSIKGLTTHLAKRAKIH